MTEILCHKCGHDIDGHFEGGCEFLHESDEYCVCDFAPSDIVHAILTAEPTEAEVEAAARAMHEWDAFNRPWVMATPVVKNMWLDAARAGLKAAVEARR